MKPILSASEAAVVIGCTPQKVWERLKRNIWTFGRVIPKAKTGQTQNSYEIIARDLAKYLSITDGELEERLERR